MNLKDNVAKGEEAARILNSPIFQDALKQVRDEAVSQLGKSSIVGQSATTEQQQLIMLLQVTNKFVKIMEDVVKTGKLSATQIQMEAKRGIFK